MLSFEQTTDGDLGGAVEVDSDLAARWPLPDANEAGDKDERGSVLVVAGSKQMPGALILSTVAAMRAGAGKLCIATAASVDTLIAQAIPESRVISLAETSEGGLLLGDASLLPERVDAVLVGPGMVDEAATVQLAFGLLRRYPTAKFVMDALAMSVVNTLHGETRSAQSLSMIVTPHPGEMAHLTGETKEQVTNDLLRAAKAAAHHWKALVALKSQNTVIAHPAGHAWVHRGGNAGLATSGSGDVLAGIIVGLCARGADLDQAAVWGVLLHARCGDALAERIGPVGFLAREIADEIPRLMRGLAS